LFFRLFNEAVSNSAYTLPKKERKNKRKTEEEIKEKKTLREENII
jgi:hypothetical protein